MDEKQLEWVDFLERCEICTIWVFAESVSFANIFAKINAKAIKFPQEKGIFSFSQKKEKIIFISTLHVTLANENTFQLSLADVRKRKISLIH